MERMDRARRTGGLAWTGAGLLLGVGWAVAGGVVPGTITLVLVVAALGLAAVVAVPRTGATAHWLAGWVMAVLLAANFAGAVADRFGAFGTAGEPGVSWGSWSVFVEYTRALLHGAPQPVAVTAAVGATVVEVALAVALLAGWQRRWVGKAAAGLLAVYLLAMVTSVGWDDVAAYALPVQIGAALLVTVCPTCRPARDRSGAGSLPALQ